VASHSDPRREVKRCCAAVLANHHAHGLNQQASDQLILLASPVTLGDRRAAISSHVHAKVVGELTHELTKIPKADGGDHIVSVLIV
jgi:protein required for attachment to host cells